MSGSRIITGVLISVSMVIGGALNVMGTYNQRHIIGIESSRAVTYTNTVYDSVENGVNFIDSKVSRSLITRVESFTKEGYIIQGVEYKCDAPLGYYLYHRLRDLSIMPKVKLTKQGSYTSCTVLY